MRVDLFRARRLRLSRYAIIAPRDRRANPPIAPPTAAPTFTEPFDEASIASAAEEPDEGVGFGLDVDSESDVGSGADMVEGEDVVEDKDEEDVIGTVTLYSIQSSS